MKNIIRRYQGKIIGKWYELLPKKIFFEKIFDGNNDGFTKSKKVSIDRFP